MLPVSIVIPTFNRSHLINRAVESVLSQISGCDEVIVVDDGSVDDTAAALAKYGDKVKYIRQENSGAGTARNRGIANAKNPLIAFLDSDDLWKDGKLELQRRFMENRRDIIFCFSDFSAINSAGFEKNNSIKDWIKGHTNLSNFENIRQILGDPLPYSKFADPVENYGDFNVYIGDIYKYELFNNIVFTGTVMANRELAGDSLHFGGNIKTFEDWQCFGAMASRGPVAYLDVETASQVSHGGDRLTDANLVTSLKTRLIVTQRVWGSDRNFLSKHGNDYNEIIQKLQLSLVRAQIAKGNNHEARLLLKQIKNSPPLYKIMAKLPSPLMNGIIAVKKLIA